MDLEFELLELRLINIERKLIQKKFDLENKYENINRNISKKVYDLFHDELNKSRNKMINQINKSFDDLISNVNKKRFKYLNYLKFKENRFESINENFILKYLDYLLSKNYLYLKFKYIKFFEANQQLEINASFKDIYNLNNLNYLNEFKTLVKVNRIVLRHNRIFYFVETIHRNCFMLITDENNFLIVRSSIINLRHFEYYQFIANGKHIVALFYDDHNYIIKLFDLNLNQLQMKIFDYRINLHSMNKYEIVCFSNKIKSDRYLVLNHELDVIYTFGQKLDIRKPFYFGDGSLIQMSFNKIFIYFYDIFEQKHSIKILNRQTGLIEKILNVDNTKYQFIKMDSSGRLMIKSINPNRDFYFSIDYYETNGDKLYKVKCDQLSNETNFDLTYDDKLYSFNQNKIKFV
jgi:hypothetical protein